MGGGGGGGGGTGGDCTPRDTDFGNEKAVSLSVRSAIPEAPSTASSRALNTSLASSVNVQSPAIEFNTVLFLASISIQYIRSSANAVKMSVTILISYINY